MKKTFGLIAAALLLAGGMVFAEETMLIDFTQLDADCCADENGNPQQNKRTVMDYSKTAGATFTQEQKDLMKTSLALPHWEVSLNSSASSVKNLAESTVVAAPVKGDANVPFAGKNVMGVHVVFPEWNSNAYAIIEPPFNIPAYEPYAQADDNGVRQPQTDEEKASQKTLFEDGYGVVKNVGTVRDIKVTFRGMQYPHGLYVLMSDNDRVTRRYFIGYMENDGWRELTWHNPQYISEIRHREIRVYPIYPRGTPFVKFEGLQITRDAAHIGGDFVGYFVDVKIIYDKAVLNAEYDIADQDLWGIINKREAKRQKAEMERFGNKQVNRFLEERKRAAETDFTSSLITETAQ